MLSESQKRLLYASIQISAEFAHGRTMLEVIKEFRVNLEYTGSTADLVDAKLVRSFYNSYCFSPVLRLSCNDAPVPFVNEKNVRPLNSVFFLPLYTYR